MKKLWSAKTFIALVATSTMVAYASVSDLKFNSVSFMNDTSVEVPVRLDEYTDRQVASIGRSSRGSAWVPFNQTNVNLISGNWQVIREEEVIGREVRVRFDSYNSEEKGEILTAELVGTNKVQLNENKVYKILKGSNTRGLSLLRTTEEGHEFIELLKVSEDKKVEVAQEVVEVVEEANTEESYSQEEVVGEVEMRTVTYRLIRASIPTMFKERLEKDMVEGTIVVTYQRNGSAEVISELSDYEATVAIGTDNVTRLELDGLQLAEGSTGQVTTEGDEESRATGIIGTSGKHEVILRLASGEFAGASLTFESEEIEDLEIEDAELVNEENNTVISLEREEQEEMENERARIAQEDGQDIENNIYENDEEENYDEEEVEEMSKEEISDRVENGSGFGF